MPINIAATLAQQASSLKAAVDPMGAAYRSFIDEQERLRTIASASHVMQSIEDLHRTHVQLHRQEFDAGLVAQWSDNRLASDAASSVLSAFEDHARGLGAVERSEVTRSAIEAWVSDSDLHRRFGIANEVFERDATAALADNAVSIAARSVIEQQEWLREMLDPAHAIRAIIEDHEPEARLQRQVCTAAEIVRQSLSQTFASNAAAEIATSVLADQEALRKAVDPSQIMRSLMEPDFTNAFLGTTDQLAGQLRDYVDQISTGMPAPESWLQPASSTAERLQTLLDAWTSQVRTDAGDWDTARAGDLADIETAIKQLPRGIANELHAGASNTERRAMVISQVGLLVQLLTLAFLLMQIQMARQDSREEQQFRDRLISLFETMATAGAPPANPVTYVVGSRPAQVKSAISGGLVLDTAHPNQILTATGRQSRWVKVRYRNHVEQRDVEGWVLKHYLIRQPHAATIDASDSGPP